MRIAREVIDQVPWVQGRGAFKVAPTEVVVVDASGHLVVVAHEVPAVPWDTQQCANHPHRDLHGQVSCEVEPTTVRLPVQGVGTELTDTGLQGGHPLRREQAPEQRAMHAVRGRVLGDDRSLGLRDPGLDELEGYAPAGDEVATVDHGPLDVIEAAQRVEILVRVAIQGRFVPETPEHRIRWPTPPLDPPPVVA